MSHSLTRRSLLSRPARAVVSAAPARVSAPPVRPVGLTYSPPGLPALAAAMGWEAVTGHAARCDTCHTWLTPGQPAYRRPGASRAVYSCGPCAPWASSPTPAAVEPAPADTIPTAQGWRYLSSARYPAACEVCDGEIATGDALAYIPADRAAGARGRSAHPACVRVASSPAPSVVTVTPPATVYRPGEVNPVIAATVADDVDILTAAGLSAGRPVYAPGSTLRPDGQGRFIRSLDEWERLPALVDALADVARTVAREDRETLRIADMGALEVDVVDGAVTLRGAGLPAVRLTADVAGALGTELWGHVLFPAAHLDRCTAEEVAAHAAGRLRRLAGRPALLGLRTMGGHRQAYRLTTERYQPGVDVGAVASALGRAVQASGQGYRGSVVYDPDTTRLTVDGWMHADRSAAIGAGSVFKAGFHASAGDNGSTGIRLSSAFLQNLCLNLLILENGSKTLLKTSHRGSVRRLTSDLTVAVDTAARGWAPFASRWGLARQIPVEKLAVPDVTRAALEIAERVAPTAPAAVVAVLAAIAADVRPDGITRDATVEALLRGWAADQDGPSALSVAGIVSAVTRLHERVPVLAVPAVARAGGELLTRWT